MAKQQYYSNYGSRGRRRRVKPRFYVFVTLIAILVMTGCFFANVAGTSKRIKYGNSRADLFRFRGN